MVDELSFYDLKGKKKFTTDKYTIFVKNGRRMAMTIAPSGVKSLRIMGRG